MVISDVHAFVTEFDVSTNTPALKAIKNMINSEFIEVMRGRSTHYYIYICRQL